MDPADKIILTTDGLQKLLDALKARGYRVAGPTLRDQAIVYDDIDGIDDLPRGWTDEQAAGRYRLARRTDEALFGYAVGPHSWKKFLHPPVIPLWRAKREGEAIEVTPEPANGDKFAFIGVRACELSAIEIQDRVFTQGPYIDPHYQARREQSFIVALNCSKAGENCFCVAMKTGPQVEAGFDIALTEIRKDGVFCFVAEAGSDHGRDILSELPRQPATAEDIALADAVIARTADDVKNNMPEEDFAEGVRDLLMRNLDHPRWNEVAERCLSCANCTMVCPTCFCTSVEETSDLTGTETGRDRRWDSCFTMDFSYVHGGSVRPSTRSRYRQWLTHKLATWHDQFGTSGCVGCGRCITWCPVGIDIREEVRAIRASERNDDGRA